MADYSEGLYLVPGHMHHAVIDYIEKGWEPGSFLTAVITNDFFGAAGAADNVNKNYLLNWAQYFYGHAPQGSWGSQQAYNKWVELGGLEGMKKIHI